MVNLLGSFGGLREPLGGELAIRRSVRPAGTAAGGSKAGPNQPWASVWIPMTPFLYRRAWQGVRRAPDALVLGLEARVRGASSGFASHHASIGPTGPTPTAKLAACAPERKTRRACTGRHTRGVSALSRGWGGASHSYPKLDGAACRTAG
jgi:hypothetical protein